MTEADIQEIENRLRAVYIMTSDKEEILLIIAELRRTRKALESAGKKLRILRNETKGTLSAHEIAIRYDAGNSNWTCLEMALSGADEALSEIEKVMKG